MRAEIFFLYTQIIAVALMPVGVTLVFCLLQNKGFFSRLPYMRQQLIIGVFFGLASIMGTEFGVSFRGEALANVRDAAPLAAGLLFGPPAGIIAGLMGGIERWFAVLWGAGPFTREACALSTCLSGFFVAAVSRYFDFTKKEYVNYWTGFSFAIVMESFHLTMVFITNFNEIEKAFMVVEYCAFPMLFGNGLSVLLCVLVARLFGFGHDKALKREENKTRLQEIVQSRLAISIIAALSLTILFTFALQTSVVKTNTRIILASGIADVERAADDKVLEAASYYRVGKNGGVIVTDAGGKALGGREDFLGKNIRELLGASLLNAAGEHEIITSTIDQTECYCMYKRTNAGGIIISYQPVNESIFERGVASYVGALMEVLAFAVLFFVIYYLLIQKVIGSIFSINAGLRQISAGDLDVRIDVRSCNEFGELSDGINSTVASLKHYIKETEKMSLKDMLTGLGNRASCTTRINELEKEKCPLGILYADANGLKAANDQNGHASGDQLIINIANILSNVMGEDVYRVGGDEFVAFKANISEADFQALVEKLKHSWLPIASASTGSIWLPRAENILSRIDQADKNMYDEKRAYYEKAERRKRRA